MAFVEVKWGRIINQDQKSSWLKHQSLSKLASQRCVTQRSSPGGKEDVIVRVRGAVQSDLGWTGTAHKFSIRRFVLWNILSQKAWERRNVIM